MKISQKQTHFMEGANMAAEKTEATVQETGVYSQENVTRRPSIFDDPDAMSSNFHRTNATEFSLLKDGIGSITLYRKYDFMLKITGDNEIDADRVYNDIVYAIDHVLSVTKAQDIEKFDNFKEINMDGRPTLIYTVFIPFSERQNLIVQNITRQIQLLNAKVEADGYKYIIRRKDMVKVLLDTNNGVSDKVFMKGVLAASHENAITDRETGEVLCGTRDHVRGNVYLNASVGLTRKEAFMFNRYN
ncbi:MAG: hypothetical protein K2N99_01370, partial [Malacoplasma sp.]|nr:hypothetical protein [Malacoplasma sp.]